MDINLITEAIIACAIKVSNTLGAGFLEKVYENALVIELRKGGWVVEQHQAQLLNYLKATGLRVGLILNFGTPKVGIKRMVL